MYAFQNEIPVNDIVLTFKKSELKQVNEFFASPFRFMPSTKLKKSELHKANEHFTKLHHEDLKNIRSTGKLCESFKIEAPTGQEDAHIYKISADLLGEYEHLTDLYFFHTLFHPFESQKVKFFLCIDDVKEEIQIQQNLLRSFTWIAGDKNATLFDLINTINY